MHLALERVPKRIENRCWYMLDAMICHVHPIFFTKIVWVVFVWCVSEMSMTSFNMFRSWFLCPVRRLRTHGCQGILLSYGGRDQPPGLGTGRFGNGSRFTQGSTDWNVYFLSMFCINNRNIRVSNFDSYPFVVLFWPNTMRLSGYFMGYYMGNIKIMWY